MSRADVIAGVLAKHRNHHNDGGHRICRCGHRLLTTSTSRVTLDRAHRAHVAVVLAAAEPVAEQAHAAAPTDAEAALVVRDAAASLLDAYNTDRAVQPQEWDRLRAALTPADHDRRNT